MLRCRTVYGDASGSVAAVFFGNDIGGKNTSAKSLLRFVVAGARMFAAHRRQAVFFIASFPGNKPKETKLRND